MFISKLQHHLLHLEVNLLKQQVTLKYLFPPLYLLLYSSLHINENSAAMEQDGTLVLVLYT